MGRGVPRSRSSSNIWISVTCSRAGALPPATCRARSSTGQVFVAAVHLPFIFQTSLGRPRQLADRIARNPQVAGDLRGRIALDKVLASNPRNRLHSPSDLLSSKARNATGQLMRANFGRRSPRLRVKEHKFTL